MLIKVTFEDHGQDFLTWIIDTELGEVVNCEPFQASIFVGSKIDQRVFDVGGFVTFVSPHVEEPLTIRYPIESVELITNHS
jgi:hypothetical protein